MKNLCSFAVLLLIGISVEVHQPVLSSGGLITGDGKGIHLNQMDAIFDVDRQAGTITAIYYIQEYVGSAQRFVWLIPVPASQPEVELTDTFYAPLDFDTIPDIRLPDHYCAGIYYGFDGGYGDGGPPRDNIVPNSYSVISAENILDWLEQNGYSTPDIQTRLSDYVAQGVSFVALPLKKDADITSGSIATIMVTYHAQEPFFTVPLRLVAAGHENIPTVLESFYQLRDPFPITISIIADSLYAVTNFESLNVDFHNLRYKSAVANLDSNPRGVPPEGNQDFFIGTGVFYEEVNKLLRNSSGQAFVTVYAGTTDKILEKAQTFDNVVSKRVEQFLTQRKFITRLFGRIPLEKLTLDPIFEPLTDSSDLLEQVDLQDYVDSLQFWGCSSRNLDELNTIYDPDRFVYDQLVSYDTIKDNLPLENRFLKDFGFSVSYPAGWVESNFEVNDGDIRVFAPEVVNAELLASYSEDKVLIPMFVIVPPYLADFFRIPCEQAVLQNLNLNIDSSNGNNCRNFIPPFTYSIPYTLVLLTSKEDWLANENLYTAMLNFPFTYQYFLSDKLRNTLFLDDSIGLEIPYPEGWSERVLQKGIIAISPDDSSTSSASIHVQHVDTVVKHGAVGYPDWVQAVADWLEQRYGVNARTVYDTVVIDPKSSCHANFGIPISFVAGERSGFIRLTDNWIVVVSSSNSDFTQNETLLREIASSTHLEHTCG